jgi:hypothetical protein
VVAPPPETLFPIATPSPTRDPHYIYAEDFKNISPYEKLQAGLGNLRFYCQELGF